MNKRIKNKVVKRVINKIGTEKLLTDFERKYFIKFFWKPLEKEIIRTSEQLKAEAELEAQSMKENVNKLSAAEIEWFGGVDFAEGPDMIVQSIVEIQKESKWQKVKGKVKGWFGK